MLTGRQVLSSAGLIAFTAVFCAAQSISPSHSGTVDYFEGDVSIDGVKLVQQTARFSNVAENGTLKTRLGRAEILLTPGVLLRVGENSSIKMLDSRLLSTRVELLSGTAMVEALESGNTIKDPAVTILYKDFEAQPVKDGIFEITSEPSQLRVFKGETRVDGNGTSVRVKDGNRIDLTMTMATSKFDAKVADDLYLWSRDRSSYLSAGNLSSARALSTSLAGGGYAASGWNSSMWNGFSGGWYYNSYLNMYSFMPFSGTMYSPFGYQIFNPVTIGYVYEPGYYWSGAGGARTGTTAGVPLAGRPSSLLSNRAGIPQLPRLGTTATLRPVATAPLRGAEVSAPRSSFGGRGVDFGGPNVGNNAPSFNNGLSANTNVQPMSSSSPGPSMSAPAVSARPSGGATVGHR